MKKSLISLAILASFSAFATEPLINQGGTCPVGTTGLTSGSCTNQNQLLGDTLSTVNNSGDTKSSASQLGNSSNGGISAASGVNITPDMSVKPQVTQNTTSDISGTNTGGNTSGTITGGNTDSRAQGNVTSADNRSSVGNTSTGASTATNGNNTNGANSNGDMVGGSNTNTVGVTGGAGGKGGAAHQGQTANGGAANQGQSNDGSGNSKNSMALKSSNNLGLSASNGGNTQSTGANTMQGGAVDQKQQQRTSNDGSGNSSTGVVLGVDASDRSTTSFTDNSRTIFIPAIIPPTPASTLATANVIKETGTCGPLQRVVEREVVGTFHGIFTTSGVKQGFYQELAPFLDFYGRETEYKYVPLLDEPGSFRVFGHQVTQYTTVVGVSGARNIAIGGGGGSGSWGQGGVGTSSANQQMVTTLQLRLCEIGMIRPLPPGKTTYVEVEHKKKPQ
jgi:hypothetical protein